MSVFSNFKLPEIRNEPNAQYAPGSPDRAALASAVEELRSQAPHEIPIVVNGERIKSGSTSKQLIPFDHGVTLANAHQADDQIIRNAIQGSLEAKKKWEALPWTERAAVFLRAADLISGKYRAKICAATMLGQGKNAWQAEIDAAAEITDFFRFGVKYMQELYSNQPSENAKGSWNRVEYRPLEGFLLAISPFNFTAIAGNLPGAPAMLGNVVVWKPSPMAMLSNYIVYEILEEAGLPAGVIQFTPSDPEQMTRIAFGNPEFAGLHFTGSTKVFKQLWKDIVSNLDSYRSYPRIVGETGGKNFHYVHNSAEIEGTIKSTIRAAFEFQGQKCSACSRLFVPKSLWENGFRERLVQEVESIKQGSPEDFTNFMGPVIARHSFDKCVSYIEGAKKRGDEIVAGGTYDDSKGFFVRPTVIVTKDLNAPSMIDEIFGPVVTAYVYNDGEENQIMDAINTQTAYALTGSIFAKDRTHIQEASKRLQNASGMLYINDKCTGAVVGSQPFGGSRMSGTNDKAGSISLLYRFVSMRTIKENYIHPTDYQYVSNQA